MSGRVRAASSLPADGRATGHHLDVGLPREQVLETLQHDGMIVDQDDADAHDGSP